MDFSDNYFQFTLGDYHGKAVMSKHPKSADQHRSFANTIAMKNKSVASYNSCERRAAEPQQPV